jgi:hypothetical protein
MLAPATHLEGLRRFPFDSVLTPYNYRLAQEPAYLRDFDSLAEETQARDVALMLIKAIARNLWRRERKRHRFVTWYEPLDEQPDVDAAVAFARAARGHGHLHGRRRPVAADVVEAERRRGSITIAEAESALAEIRGMKPPFVRVPGREVPEWLEPDADVSR